MTNLKFFISILIVSLISSCGLLDRKGSDDVVADLETIPQETTTMEEPSILIDDTELMPDADTIQDDGSLARDEQISSDPSGTFVGQKILPLREDFTAVLEAFNVHRDSYD